MIKEDTDADESAPDLSPTLIWANFKLATLHILGYLFDIYCVNKKMAR
jgi:hypothetical protein